MEPLSPAQITAATFRTTRKGYDPDEVDAFLTDVAKALEDARQQATAMEARARAAVARLQEASVRPDAPTDGEMAPAPTPGQPVRGDAPVQIPPAEAETISRTLFLAQKTADATVAEARSEADRIVRTATADAEATIDSTREMSAQMLEEARLEARKASEDERRAAENEVEALVARREFLVADVDQLERFLIDQRDRLRGAARQIEALVERVPEGLGAVRPPVLSASNDHDELDPTQELIRPSGPGSAHRSTDHDDTVAAESAPDVSPAEPTEPAQPAGPAELDAGSETDAPDADLLPRRLSQALDESVGESGARHG